MLICIFFYKNICRFKKNHYLCIRVPNKGQPSRAAYQETQAGLNGAGFSDYQVLQFVRSGARLIYQAERAENPAISVNIGSETLSDSGSVMAIVFGVAKLCKISVLPLARPTSKQETGFKNVNVPRGTFALRDETQGSVYT
jgi:hypothetical protein